MRLNKTIIILWLFLILISSFAFAAAETCIYISGGHASFDAATFDSSAQKVCIPSGDFLIYISGGHVATQPNIFDASITPKGVSCSSTPGSGMTIKFYLSSQGGHIALTDDIFENGIPVYCGEPGCEKDADCGDDRVCVNKKCETKPCTADNECQSNYCNPKTRKCGIRTVSDLGGKCGGMNPPCKTGLTCSNAICGGKDAKCGKPDPNCRAGQTCNPVADNTKCVSGECVLDKRTNEYMCTAPDCTKDKPKCKENEICDKATLLCKQVVCTTNEQCRTKDSTKPICQDNICVAAPKTCAADKDCGAYKCGTDGKCEVICLSQLHCNDGYSCSNNQCVKTKLLPGEFVGGELFGFPTCEKDDDCEGENKECLAGFCLDKCTKSSECKDNSVSFICIDNTCQPCDTLNDLCGDEYGYGYSCVNGRCSFDCCLTTECTADNPTCVNTNNLCSCKGEDLCVGVSCESYEMCEVKDDKSSCINKPCETGNDCSQGTECKKASSTDEWGQCTPPVVGCTLKSECKSGEVCYRGSCSKGECTEDGDCADGGSCDLTTLGCIPKELPVGGCEKDIDCPPGSYCSDSLVCDRFECGDDLDCPPGSECKNSQCETAGCAVANVESDCRGTGFVCVNELCTIQDGGECEADTDCPTDYVCGDGSCWWNRRWSDKPCFSLGGQTCNKGDKCTGMPVITSTSTFCCAPSKPGEKPSCDSKTTQFAPTLGREAYIKKGPCINGKMEVTYCTGGPDPSGKLTGCGTPETEPCTAVSKKGSTADIPFFSVIAGLIAIATIIAFYFRGNRKKM